MSWNQNNPNAPGVYIQEENVPGAISGVSTSIVAIIGPALTGDINQPFRLTKFSDFEDNYGKLKDLALSPRIYSGFAVKGFFDNDGKICYFVRVGTASRAHGTLVDSGTPAGDVLTVTAKQTGAYGNAIRVHVKKPTDSTSVEIPSIRLNLSSISEDRLSAVTADISNLAKFKNGDRVIISQNTLSQPVTIKGIGESRINFEDRLLVTFQRTEATMALATIQGTNTIYLDDLKDIEEKTYLKVTRGGDTPLEETAIVDSIDKKHKFIKLKEKLKQNFQFGTQAIQLIVIDFNLEILENTVVKETHRHLSMEPSHTRYYGKVLSALVEIRTSDKPSPNLPPFNLPAETKTDETSPVNDLKLKDGENEEFSKITNQHYQNAIDTLERVDEVSIICSPDGCSNHNGYSTDIRKALIGHCEKMEDRFAILDCDPGSTLDGVTNQRNVLGSDRGYAAIYYPWLVVTNPNSDDNERKISIPPSGHIAGIYARSDSKRGIHKAPANETIQGVLGLESYLTSVEQGLMNSIQINTLKFIPGRGNVVWGARTISVFNQWRYVNVRRLLLYIEESIQKATEFAVFEPNNYSLWQTVKRQVVNFLMGLWQEGALFGATSRDAFNVRVDEELNPQTLREQGILMIEVKLYPTTPAEFIVFRIIQQPGGPPAVIEG